MNWTCPVCHQPVDPAAAHGWYRWRFHVDEKGRESYERDAHPESYTHRGECTATARFIMLATSHTSQ